jgi:hypothetical protein
MRPMAFFGCSICLKIGLRLAEAEMIIRSAPDHFSIVFVLAVIMPKADLTDFVLPASTKGFEFATWASIRRRRLVTFDDVLEGLG